MSKFRVVLTAAMLLPLGACGVYNAHEQKIALNYAVPNGSPFTQRLTVEYRDMANEGIDPDHFSRKGLEASISRNVLPESPTDYSISDGVSGTILQNRTQLIDLLDHGGRNGAPIFSAVAQARFDCWVVSSSHDANGKDAIVCHTQFDEAMAQARAALVKPAPAAEPVVPADELHAARFLVFFDWNKATVTSGRAIGDRYRHFGSASPGRHAHRRGRQRRSVGHRTV